ncbi:MAG TPA: hypothetical protein PK981_11635 [Accumulibacter sp.]|nr:hypothetical protein [Accumulibacter sp.]HMW18254.1 hypothetical protein [Accumulibacter sp.]HNC16805.1 hypothetical protein [Accumulibacter sp.]HND80411.1 hypothetical protein [Accumulibacter sp.]HNE12206.1 hypothetical protein [Accumulibacter sp.]
MEKWTAFRLTQLISLKSDKLLRAINDPSNEKKMALIWQNACVRTTVPFAANFPTLWILDSLHLVDVLPENREPVS